MPCFGSVARRSQARFHADFRFQRRNLRCSQRRQHPVRGQGPVQRARAQPDNRAPGAGRRPLRTHRPRCCLHHRFTCRLAQASALRGAADAAARRPPAQRPDLRGDRDRTGHPGASESVRPQVRQVPAGQARGARTATARRGRKRSRCSSRESSAGRRGSSCRRSAQPGRVCAEHDHGAGAVGAQAVCRCGALTACAASRKQSNCCRRAVLWRSSPAQPQSFTLALSRPLTPSPPLAVWTQGPLSLAVSSSLAFC